MACAKRRYRTELDAMLAMQSTGRNPNRAKHEVRAYRCSNCRGWHLTSRRR